MSFRTICRNRFHRLQNNNFSMRVELTIMISILLMLLRTALNTLCKISITAVILSIRNNIIYQTTEGSNKGPKKRNRHQGIYCMKWVSYNNKSNYNKLMNSLSLAMVLLINKKILPEEWLKLMRLIQEKRLAKSSQKLTILKGPFRN